ncbi:MAG: Stk1 family PASTA domain-containing Ser/Thr kinase [Microbacteriaceae bacterium]
MEPSNTDPVIGRRIDARYRVLSKIARGGMATVYLATDERLERRVALKVMHHHLTDDAGFRERFIREAHSAARLAHPNVVSVFDQGQDQDMAYLVMEYLPGITLRELLEEHGQLTAEQALDIMEAVLSGLAAAHQAGIVHRDIKPENVLLADDGRIKLSDFGLARPSSSATATGQALLGTIAYLSPELLTRGVADVRSDIYAIGIMLYEMITGKQPFVGEQPMQIAYQHANDSVGAPSLIVPGIPQELDELVLWATAKDPDDRPANAGELLTALREVRSLILPSAVSHMDQTMVLEPAADQFSRGNQATEIIQERIAPARSTRTSTGVLEQRTLKRNRRGKILFAIVMVLALFAGGTGWYFGSGPGAMVTIPEFQNQEQALVEAQLAKLDLKYDFDESYDYSTDLGKVSRTDPAAGEQVQKGSTITIVLSLGPKPIELPMFSGLTVDVAKALITSSDFSVGNDLVRQFSADVPKDTVIAAYDAEGNLLEAGKDYFEKAPISLLISAGAVPSVVDLSLGAAESELRAVGLEPVRGEDAYSDNIVAGNVVSLVAADVLSVGDTPTLIVSKGPAPVKIPDDLVGKKWSNKIKQQLLDAGFSLDYNQIADAFPAFYTISAIDPAPGKTVPRGTKLKISFSL